MSRNQSKSPKTDSGAVASHLYFGDSAYFQLLKLRFAIAYEIKRKRRRI
jgi:hypothetical protein